MGLTILAVLFPILFGLVLAFAVIRFFVMGILEWKSYQFGDKGAEKDLQGAHRADREEFERKQGSLYSKRL